MKIIQWLLQPTSDGATYLQAVILGFVAISLFAALTSGLWEMLIEYIRERNSYDD